MVRLLCVLLCALAPTSGAERALVISGATLVDGTGAPPVADAVVVVEGNRIVAAGPRAKVPVPNGARVVDARGRWVMPGLVDAHVHFFQSGGIYTRPDVVDLRARVPYTEELARIRRRLPETFRRYLCSGVTAVVDAGGPMWNFEVRDLAARTDLAPRVAVAGPLVSTYAPPALETDDPAIVKVDSPDAARALVRRELARKPDLMKVWFIRRPGQSLEDSTAIVRATVEESHAAGVRVAVHATELETAKAAVRAGCDVLVHSVYDVAVDDEFVALLKERKVLYEPTLVVQEGYAEALGRRVELTGVECECGDPETIASWAAAPEPNDATAARLGRYASAIRVGKANLKRLADAGVAIAAATDAGNIGTLHGPSLHRELELMAEAGLTPMQILVAATRDAARVFSATPAFGTVEPGKLADLLVLDADPLADVRNARRIRLVVKDGRVIERDTLRSSRKEGPCR
jgi:imidazolonepropionase-like amidohydrolase